MKFILTKYSNLKQRVITAIIGGGILITAIWYNEWSYFLVFFLICMFSMLEFYKLLGLDGHIPLKYWGTFTGSFIFSLTFLIEKDLISSSFYYLIFPVSSCIFFIKLYKKNDKKPFTNIAYTFLGICYVAVPFSLLNASAFIDNKYNFQIVLGCLFILWASDSGAYFAGTKFGKTKLFERISPKKSWEGSIGGGMAALVIAFLVGYFYTDLALWKWLSIAVIIVVAGTYGDLVESLFKRSIQIKDSGSVIPGHGGFLDRFDGLLLSAPFIAGFLKLF